VTDESAPAHGRHVEDDFSDLTFATKVKVPAPLSGSQRAAAEEILRRPRLGTGYFLVTEEDLVTFRADVEKSMATYEEVDRGARQGITKAGGPTLSA
jgi:hypothetical protein